MLAQGDTPGTNLEGQSRGRLAALRKLRYTVVFEPQPEGGYVVSIPAHPGCVTGGGTLREARRMAGDAIQAWCGSLLEDGLPLPRDVRSTPVHERLDVTLSTA